MNMKKITSLILTFILLVTCSCVCQAEKPSEQTAGTENAAEGETMIYAHIGDNTLTIKPESNSSAEEFIKLLQSGDVTVNMHDYGGFEKVGPLGTSLSTNDERITTEPGDVILYQGNQITIYYDTNTWSFTRLGKVQGMTAEEIRAALGDGDPAGHGGVRHSPRGDLRDHKAVPQSVLRSGGCHRDGASEAGHWLY